MQTHRVDDIHLQPEEDELRVRLTLDEHPEDPEQPYLGVYFAAISLRRRVERRYEERDD